jgi:hypothetical protein
MGSYAAKYGWELFPAREWDSFCRGFTESNKISGGAVQTFSVLVVSIRNSIRKIGVLNE